MQRQGGEEVDGKRANASPRRCGGLLLHKQEEYKRDIHEGKEENAASGVQDDHSSAGGVMLEITRKVEFGCEAHEGLWAGKPLRSRV